MDKSEWEGRVGDVWAEEWRRTDRSFVPIDTVLVATALELLAHADSPRVLDVGCGAGTTSQSLARSVPTARITGVDLSQALIDVARSRAADMPRLRFEQGDASRWAGEGDFDMLVSRHGVMFFDDAVAAFTHLHSLARPGGRLVFSCFRAAEHNLWASGLNHLIPGATPGPHAPGPFAFADEKRVQGILRDSGWRDASAVPLDFDYVAGEGDDPAADAADYFRRIGPVARALRELDADGRARLLDGLAALVAAHVDGNRVILPAAAWIWSATA